MRKVFFLLLSAAAIFAGGCATAPVSPSEKLSLRLNCAGSSSIRIVSMPPVHAMLEECFSQTELLLAKQPEARFLQEMTSLGAIFFHASGFREIAMYGSSSCPLSADAGKPLYLNRYCALKSPGGNGFLWTLLTPSGTDFSEFIRKLPEGTLLAATFNLAPQNIIAALQKHADVVPEELDEFCREKFRKNADEILEGFAGNWELILFNRNDAPGFLLSFPDREQRLAPYTGAISALLNRFQITLLPELHAVSRDGRLFLMSAQAEELLAQAPTLQETSPDFVCLQKQLPAKGAGFFYAGKKFSQLLLPPSGVYLQNMKHPFVIGVPETSPDGIEITSLSNCDINELELFSSLLLPLHFVVSELDKREKLQQKKQQFIREFQQAEKQGRICSDHLKVLYEALLQYARKHDGKFPALLTDLSLSGEDLLCPVNKDVPYVYFSGMSRQDNPHYPLLFDFARHGRMVNILLLNGEILTIELPGILSSRRIVSTLQSRFRYPEKELQMLLQKADTTDKTMEF